MTLNYYRLIPFLTISLYSCAVPKITVQQIGKLNMISERNIDTKAEYVLLKSYMGASDKEKRASTSTTIEDATNETVKNTPGGEFLKNVKVYTVSMEKRKEVYFAIEGDVWGFAGAENFRGFKVGDKVQWKDVKGTMHKGKITGLNDSKECMVKEAGKETSKLITYDRLIKISNDED